MPTIELSNDDVNLVWQALYNLRGSLKDDPEMTETLEHIRKLLRVFIPGS